MPQESFAIKNRENLSVKEPGRFKVVFHNDDFTTMDFVIYVLKQVFFKSDTDAFSIMMAVHQKGRAVVGTYSFDIAKSKRNKAIGMAREEGYPLNITIEAE